ncbi:MAG: hypothetical protein HDR88_16730 [Bacteroides sp.]|nr:hypothetical protein [Bacteroides sp.]
MIKYTPNYCVHLPVSKSIGARYLVASFFAGTLPACREFDDCDDLKVIQKALNTVLLNENKGDTEVARVDVGASGTAFRFMAAVIASTPGADFILTGTHRLVGRPMTPLLNVLRDAGAFVENLGNEDKGPYRIKGGMLKGGEFKIRGDISSQFISALMLVAPTWENGMTLHFSTPLVSRPYIEMTAKIMERFSIIVELGEDHVSVKRGHYVAPEHFEVEADWSAASYFFAAKCFSSDWSSISGLVPPGKSLQGDSAVVDFFLKMGVGCMFNDEGVVVCRVADANDYVEIDLTNNPDLMPALAIGALMQGTRFKFTGVRNLRLKESDRLLAMKTEIEKLGYPIEVGEDSIEWQGGASPVPACVINTYDDHRIAMAFAVMARLNKKISIANPEVVNKSFPGFWDQLPVIGLECRREGDVMNVFRKDFYNR